MTLLPPPPPPPPPVHWASQPETEEGGEAFGTYGAEGYEGEEGEYYEEEGEQYEAGYDEYGGDDGEPQAASTSDGGRVLLVQRPPQARKASNSGPATPPLQPGELPPNFKTALCRHWQQGSCSHGSKCNFAHGEGELRRPGQQQRPSNYRTVVCKFWRDGYCRHGSRCTFLHGGAQQRRQGPQKQAAPPRPDMPSPLPLAGAAPAAPPLAGQPAAPPLGPGEQPRDLLGGDAQGLASLLQGAHLNSGAPGGAAPPPVHHAYSAAANGHAAWAAPASTAPPPPPPPTGFGAPAAGDAPPVALSGELRAVLQRRFSSLLCPITLQPFQEPVVAADGNIYERRAIEEWLYRSGNDTSPLTHERLPHKMVMPCATVRRCVEEVAAFVAAMQRQVL